jgi:hypothetical protein
MADMEDGKGLERCTGRYGDGDFNWACDGPLPCPTHGPKKEEAKPSSLAETTRDVAAIVDRLQLWEDWADKLVDTFDPVAGGGVWASNSLRKLISERVEKASTLAQVARSVLLMLESVGMDENARLSPLWQRTVDLLAAPTNAILERKGKP